MENFIGDDADGKTDDRKRRDRATAHGIHVAYRVGRRNLSEGVRIVDRRREDVDRLHQRLVFVEFVHTGIVGRGHPHQDARIGDRR